MSVPTSSPAASHAPVEDCAGRRPRVVAFFLCLTAILLAIDLATKTLAFRYVAGSPVELSTGVPSDYKAIPEHDPVAVVPWALSLRLTVNDGAVFGIGRGKRWAFVAISAVAVAVIGRLFARSESKAWVMHLALSLILAGALGNLYDRVRFGVVRDMMYLFPGVKLPFGLRWPAGEGGGPGSDELYPWIFNVADMQLLAGVGVMIVLMWLQDQARKPAPASKADPH